LANARLRKMKRENASSHGVGASDTAAAPAITRKV
jgi:hypothetical protein